MSIIAIVLSSRFAFGGTVNRSAHRAINYGWPALISRKLAEIVDAARARAIYAGRLYSTARAQQKEIDL